MSQSPKSLQGNLRDLETRPVGRLLWEYSLPAVAGMVVMSLYNVIDRIFIGQGVGPLAISGLAVTFPVMNLTTALGVLIGVGGSSRVSILLGRKEHDMAAHVLG
jgi:Na+-driven multidrug efflux pump